MPSTASVAKASSWSLVLRVITARPPGRRAGRRAPARRWPRPAPAPTMLTGEARRARPTTGAPRRRRPPAPPGCPAVCPAWPHLPPATSSGGSSSGRRSRVDDVPAQRSGSGRVDRRRHVGEQRRTRRCAGPAGSSAGGPARADHGAGREGVGEQQVQRAGEVGAGGGELGEDRLEQLAGPRWCSAEDWSMIRVPTSPSRARPSSIDTSRSRCWSMTSRPGPMVSSAVSIVAVRVGQRAGERVRAVQRPVDLRLLPSSPPMKVSSSVERAS